MGAKNVLQRLGEELKPTVQSTTELPSVLLRADYGIGAEILPALRAEMNRALNEYNKGRYKEAEEIILKTKEGLTRVLSSQAGLEIVERVKFFLLNAAACTLLGRVREREDKGDEAHAAFTQAVNLFDQWMPKAKEIADPNYEPKCVDYRDYGIALYKVNRRRESLENFRIAVERGDKSAETYRYLSSILRERKLFDEAKRLLQEALKVLPDDPFVFKALAETLEDKGEFAEAAEAYRRSALVLGSTGRLDEALKILNRALDLNVGDPKAFALQGELLRLMGRSEEALHALEKALALTPEDASTLASKAVALHTLGRHEEALRALDQALTLVPNYVFALGYKGEVLRIIGRFEEALKMIDEALALTPDDAYIVGTKGQILSAMNRNEEATAVLQQAVSLNPDLVWAHAELGETLRRVGRYEEALRALDTALDVNANSAFAFGTKGQILNHLHRYQEAVEALQRAIDLDPTLGWVHAELGVALSQLGRYEEGQRALDHARALTSDKEASAKASDNEATLRFKGRSLYALGRYEEALTTLDKALELSPHDVFALVCKGETLRQMERFEEALKMIDEALALTPDDAYIVGTKGQILNSLGQHQEAIAALQQAVSLNSKLGWAHAELGETLRRVGRYEEALRALNEALTLDSHDTSALVRKGETLRVLGRHEEALETLDQALAEDPKDSWVLGIKGATLQAMARHEEAVRTLDEALQISSDDDWAWGVKSVSLQALNQYEEASEALDQALALNPKKDYWILLKGNLLIDIAEYEAAAKLLDQVTELNPSTAWIFGSKGFALEMMGPRHAQKAHQAFEAALAMKPGILGWRAGVGDSLYLLGEKQKAMSVYRSIIAEVKERSEVDADVLSLRGWCHYRLGEYDESEYDEAIRLFVEARSLVPDIVYVQFDLALTLMCSERYSLALQEYLQGVTQAEGKGFLRSRGLLFTALNDIKEAVTARPKLQQVREAREGRDLLHRALNKAKDKAKTTTSSIVHSASR